MKDQPEFKCPHCGQLTGAEAVIVSLWSEDFERLNAWLAKTHPEFVNDSGMTPWGVLSYKLEEEKHHETNSGSL